MHAWQQYLSTLWAQVGSWADDRMKQTKRKNKKDTQQLENERIAIRNAHTWREQEEKHSSWYILVNIVGQEIRCARNVVVASSLEPLKVGRDLATLHPLLKSQGCVVVDRVAECFGGAHAQWPVAVFGGAAATAVRWAAYNGALLSLMSLLLLSVYFLVPLLMVEDFYRPWWTIRGRMKQRKENKSEKWSR